MADMRARVAVTVRISPENERPAELIEKLGLLALAGGAGFIELVKEVVQATLLQAVLKRFGEAEPRFKTISESREDPDLTERIAETQKDLNKARSKGLNQRAESLARTLDRLQTKYHGKGSKHERHQTVGGHFADSISKVERQLKLIRDSAGRGGSTTIGFGSIEALDAIHTTANETKSKFNILWRQLEFGTGIFVERPGPRTDGPSKTFPAGSWLFGQTHVLGSRPGNFLRMAAGIPYAPDAVLFRDALTKALRSHLS